MWNPPRKPLAKDHVAPRSRCCDDSLIITSISTAGFDVGQSKAGRYKLEKKLILSSLHCPEVRLLLYIHLTDTLKMNLALSESKSSGELLVLKPVQRRRSIGCGKNSRILPRGFYLGVGIELYILQ